jgi:hypothetical protein
MKTRTTVIGIVVLIGLIFGAAQAQQPQIPTLQVCNETGAKGRATVQILSRKDATHSGSFDISVELKCSANPGYPAGTLQITNLSMSDSTVQGALTATAFEQVTSTGRVTPTLYLNGWCKAEKIVGCRFWLMIADNKKSDQDGTPDVVSFLVFDGLGKRMAYGTGPVVKGDLTVAPTSN